MSPTLVRRMRHAGIVVLAAFSLLGASPATAGPPDGEADAPRPMAVRRACAAPVRPGEATCLALVRTDVAAHRGVQALGPPTGLGAVDLQRAYNLPSSTEGKDRTLAIIDVYDNPHAESDLAVYRAQYGLPPCTTANGCFKKVNENGGSELPSPDVGWAEEESLDLDIASAACPNCHLLLVEADRPALASLGTGVNTAIRMGARYISNSYGSREDASTVDIDRRYFQHPGVAITAASGDGGYGVLYPSSSRHVTAVGGTSLSRAANPRGWNETAWSGGGSGCSGFATKPSWQTDTGCARRTVADVSAVADPKTGVAVYDTYGAGGWLVVGGTSAAAPLIAGAYALAGRPSSDAFPAASPYINSRVDPHLSPPGLNDITSGSNGTCQPDYLCTAGPGYDGPTGLGTPNGVSAFRSPPSALARPGDERSGPDKARAKAAERPTTTDRQGTATGRPNTADQSNTANRPGTAAQPVAAVRATTGATGGGTQPGGGLTNGGFETGKLTGWSPSGLVTTTTTSGPHSGRYAAELGDPDIWKKGDSSISQRFTAPQNHRRLSFWYSMSCPDRVTYDWALATLKDETTGATRTVLPKTCTWDPSWQQVTAPIVGGHAYLLTLLNHDDGYYGDPTATKYDDVATS